MCPGLRLPGAVAIALTAASLLTSCGSPPTEAVGPVRVGLVVPLSGPSATYGNSAQQGAQLAVELLNESNQEIGLPLFASGFSSNFRSSGLELIAANTGSEPDKAADEVGRLATDTEIAVLVGAYDDGATAAASARAEEVGIPFVNVDSTQADLTERGLQWFFRMGPSDGILTEAFLRLMERVTAEFEGESRRVGVVYLASPPETSIALEISEVAQAAGYDVVDMPLADPGGDLGMLTQRESAVDAVIAVALDVDGAAETVRRLRDTEVLNTAAIVGMGEGFESEGFTARAQEASADVLIVSDWAAELAERGGPITHVADLYVERFSTPLTAEAAASFTAVYAIARALEDAASEDRTKVRAALANLNVPGREVIMPWDGIHFDQAQQNSAARGVVSQVVGDSPALVYPFDLARQSVRWPAAPGRVRRR
jgi:branched-chain amino acid transport system substrate-binding protein